MNSNKSRIVRDIQEHKVKFKHDFIVTVDVQAVPSEFRVEPVIKNSIS